MLGLLRRTKDEHVSDAYHFSAHRYDVVSERMLSAAPRSHGEQKEEQDVALAEVPAECFDSASKGNIAVELAKLPPQADAEMLDGLVDRRSWILERLNEKLAGNIIHNWDRFLEGLRQVDHVYKEIQHTYLTVKSSRASLAYQLAEAQGARALIQKWRRRDGLATLSTLANHVAAAKVARAAIMEAQADGSYYRAFEQCAHAAALVRDGPVSRLHVAGPLAAGINAFYAESLAQMASALLTVCTDFHAANFEQVMLGFYWLHEPESAKRQIAAAFDEAAEAAVSKVVRGMAAARRGLRAPEPSDLAATLQDSLCQLPGEQFRVCLSRVLMILWNVLASHFRMRVWLADQLQISCARRAALEQVVHINMQLQGANPSTSQGNGNSDMLEGDEGPGTPPPLPPRRGIRAADAFEGCLQLEAEGVDTHSLANGRTYHSQPISDPGDDHIRNSSLGKDKTIGREHAVVQSMRSEPLHLKGLSPECPTKYLLQTARHLQRHQPKACHEAALGSGHLPSAQQDLYRADDEAAMKLQAEVRWAELLAAVGNHLLDGRGALWAQAVPRLSLLLSSPAACNGEHFLQVTEWAQTILRVGEAFTGAPSAALRVSLLGATSRSFPAYHHANLGALQSLLRAEAWTALSLPADRLPTLKAAFNVSPPDDAVRSEASPDHPDFGALVAAGNPWHVGHLRSSLAVARSASESNSSGASSRPADSVTRECISPDHSQQSAHVRHRQDEQQLQQRAESLQVHGHQCQEQPRQQQVGAVQLLRHQHQQCQRQDDVGQQQQFAGPGATTVTSASYKMLMWLSEYASLTWVRAAEACQLYSAVCQLFDLYLVTTFQAFSDVALDQIVNAAQPAFSPHSSSVQSVPAPQHQGIPRHIPHRLRVVLTRITNQSLAPHREILLPHTLQSIKSANTSHSVSRGRSTSDASVRLGRFQMARTYTDSLPPSEGVKSRLSSIPPADCASTKGSDQLSSQYGSVAWHSGNFFGMQERKVAVDALLTLGGIIECARPELRVIGSAPGVPGFHAPDAFFQSLAAIEDVRDVIWATGARAALPMAWLPADIAHGSFAVLDPPSKPSQWVAQLLAEARLFGERLATLPTLQLPDLEQLWRHALAALSEAILEGFSSISGRCTPMGRASMSLDLQQVSNGISELLPHEHGEASRLSAIDALRIVDNYVKAYYIPWGPDLQQWALTHPEYSSDQLAALLTLIADSQGIRRKERDVALAALTQLM